MKVFSFCKSTSIGYMYRFFQVLGLLLSIAGFTLASSPPESTTDSGLANRNPSSFEVKPSLYLDCHGCDYNYIRQEINFVNYVRDQEQADIHLFIRFTSTGDGGREYDLNFIGRRRFSE